MTVNREGNMRKSSASISFSLSRSRGSFLPNSLCSLITTQSNTFIFCEMQQRIFSRDQYLWVPSFLGRQFSKFCRLFRSWWVMWWSSGQWCVGVVRYTLHFHAWLLQSPTQSLRQVGFQTEWRGSDRRIQGPGRWKDPGSRNRVVKDAYNTTISPCVSKK